jgi:hypothetical protein
MTDDKPDDLTRALPPIWGDDKNLRLKPDNRETELSKALRTILSPDFDANETAPREPQPGLARVDATQVDTSAEAVERLAVEIAGTVLDGIHGEPLEYVLRRGYAAMGLSPGLAAEMCRKLAACQTEDASALARERDNLANLSSSQAHTIRCNGELAIKRRAERDAALSRAEAAEAERDALRVVARAVNKQMNDAPDMAIIAEVEDAMCELVEKFPEVLNG